MTTQLKEIRFKQQKKLNPSNLYLHKSITSYIQKNLVFLILLLSLFVILREITHPSINLGITVDYLITTIANYEIRNRKHNANQFIFYRKVIKM